MQLALFTIVLSATAAITSAFPTQSAAIKKCKRGLVKNGGFEKSNINGWTTQGSTDDDLSYYVGAEPDPSGRSKFIAELLPAIYDGGVYPPSAQMFQDLYPCLNQTYDFSFDYMVSDDLQDDTYAIRVTIFSQVVMDISAGAQRGSFKTVNFRGLTPTGRDDSLVFSILSYNREDREPMLVDRIRVRPSRTAPSKSQ